MYSPRYYCTYVETSLLLLIVLSSFLRFIKYYLWCNYNIGAVSNQLLLLSSTIFSSISVTDYVIRRPLHWSFRRDLRFVDLFVEINFICWPSSSCLMTSSTSGAPPDYSCPPRRPLSWFGKRAVDCRRWPSYSHPLPVTPVRRHPRARTLTDIRRLVETAPWAPSPTKLKSRLSVLSRNSQTDLRRYPQRKPLPSQRWWRGLKDITASVSLARPLVTLTTRRPRLRQARRPLTSLLDRWLWVTTTQMYS